VVRLLHVTLYAVVSRHDADVLGAVRRLATGIVIAPLLILGAGFLPAGPARGVLWALALLVDFGSPLVAGTTGWKVDAGHFTERHGLVIIIALGESVVAVGVTAAGEPLTAGVVAAATLSVAIVASMWWLYFDVVALAAERKLHSLTGRDLAAMARDSYSYLHLFMVWGIVLVALGLKESLSDLTEPLSAVPAVALLGGLAVYLLAHVAFRLRNMRTLNRQRLVAAVVLVLLIPVAVRVESLATIGIATAVMVVLVVYEVIRFREGRHYLRHHSAGETH